MKTTDSLQLHVLNVMVVLIVRHVTVLVRAVRHVTERANIAASATLLANTHLATEQERVLLVMEQEGGARHAKEQDRALIATMVNAANVRELAITHVVIVLVLATVRFVAAQDIILMAHAALEKEPEYVNNVMELVQQDRAPNAVGTGNAIHVEDPENALRVKGTLDAALAMAAQNVRHAADQVIVPHVKVSLSAVPVEVMAIVANVITATESVPLVMA